MEGNDTVHNEMFRLNNIANILDIINGDLINIFNEHCLTKLGKVWKGCALIDWALHTELIKIFFAQVNTHKIT
jgi:hypothetical protein